MKASVDFFSYLFIYFFITNASVDLVRPYRVNDFMYFYYINK